ERFGFRLSKHTENLIKTALKMKLFDRLTGTRLYEEFDLIFKENNPVAVLRRLDESGLLGVVHTSLKLTDRLEALLSNIYDVLHWFELLFTEEHPDQPIMYLMALLCELEESQMEEAMGRLMVPPRVREQAVQNMKKARKALNSLPGEKPSDVYATLSPLKLEALLFAMALTRSEEKKKDISQYLLEMRKTRPLLTGNDLKKLGIPPGPAYSKVLNDLLMERLNGTLVNREDEIAFVRTQTGSNTAA
ncbi:MAG: hypothetical protein GWN77_01035, partial [Gammaproteobacteria bacterium]|nr:hypothetical protein [Gammaproteobacteria bacterium]